MTKNTFFKIWSMLFSSMAIFPTESLAEIVDFKQESEPHNYKIIAKATSKPDLFLQQARETYSDLMLFAGHRSHSSHRSHYSSRTYSAPTLDSSNDKSSSSSVYPSSNYKDSQASPKTTNPQLSPMTKSGKIDTTGIKIVQVSLNLLGYDAGKVDGLVGGETREALNKFQEMNNITISGKIDSETCLFLYRKLANKFPDNHKIKEMQNYLLQLYINMNTASE